jgi:hypothetical protein
VPVKAEVIRKFEVNLKVKADCSLDVEENIFMDFEQSTRHGIFRHIPLQYTRHGGDYTLGFDLLSVTDTSGSPLHYVESHGGGEVTVRIGDPDKLLSGRNNYRIHYLVRRAVNFFDNSPEVYWNATGNDWPYGIEETVVHFYPPGGVNLNEIKTTSYVGRIGSTKNAEIRPGAGGQACIDFLAPYLSSGEGLTIVARLPAGSVTRPSLLQQAIEYVMDWWGLVVIPGITCLYLLPKTLRRNRDPEHRAISVEWNPPKNLSPAEVGTLVDENCDMQDIVSTLIDLAARGYLNITELHGEGFLFLSTKDYLFTQTHSQKKDDQLLPHEEEFLSALFTRSRSSVKLSDLRERFYVHLPIIRTAIYQSLTNKKLFVENPERVRGGYQVVAVLVFTAGLIMGTGGYLLGHGCIGGGLIASSVIIFITAFYMPARTKEGWKERAEILAFRRFVRLAEKDRIALLAKNDPTIFGRLLPFAMVLGAADQWAQAFRDLLTEPPSWYVPYGYGDPDYRFSSAGFVHDLGNGMNTMGHTFASTPSSSGSSAGSGDSGFSGGSSGGGFGGGGGGSW